MVFFDQGEEARFSYAEDPLDVGAFNFVVQVTLEKVFDLVVGELFVQVSHNRKPPVFGLRL